MRYRKEIKLGVEADRRGEGKDIVPLVTDIMSI